MKTIKRILTLIAMMGAFSALLTSCSERVPQGYRGRISTANGWDSRILKPGVYACYGRDKLYLVDSTTISLTEKLNILIGGKVNLKVDVKVRCRANVEDEDLMREAFENVMANDKNIISAEQLYNTFLQQKTLAIPKQVYEVQVDVETAVINGPELVKEARKQIMDIAKTTSLLVVDMDMTNYDWPESITKAQENLVGIQLKQAAAVAQVEADLAKAEGDLKVEEANKLVEIKRAEAIAESIDIIKDKLAGSPEYLLWHQIRVMGDAAAGPNNCFILYPYNTDAGQMKQMVNNANLVQMLKPEGPHPEVKKEMAEELKNAAEVETPPVEK